MRCPNCRSYLPQLPESSTFETCPQCQSDLSSTEKTLRPFTKETTPQSSSQTKPQINTEPFAPYFTVQACFSFIPNHIQDLSLPFPTGKGSISFGKEGFSIVSNDGKTMEKFYYRECETPRQENIAVYLSRTFSNLSHKDFTLIFNHPWLPYALSKSYRIKRAQTFHDLLLQVQKGLSNEDVSHYQTQFKT